MTDRNQYRMHSDARLLEEARYNPNAELAIVLAERLEEIHDAENTSQKEQNDD